MAMESRGLSTWHGTALVVGTGGIGSALLEALAERAPNLQLLGASRQRPPGWEGGALADTPFTPVDLTEPSSLGGLQRRLGDLPPLRVVINTAGVLHGPDLQPEKRLSQLTQANLAMSFGLNAFGPIFLAQALESLLPRDQPGLAALATTAWGAGTATGRARPPRTSYSAPWPSNGSDGSPWVA